MATGSSQACFGGSTRSCEPCCILSFLPKIAQSHHVRTADLSNVMLSFIPARGRNIVVDEAVEESAPDKPEMGMIVIRGNSIVMIEAKERV